MIPEGNPHAKTAGKNGRSQKFKEALTTRFWQPLPCKHLLPCIGWFDILPLRLGVGGGSSPCENPHPRGPLSHVWVSIVTCFFFPLFFLFHIFVVVFVSAPASTSIRALSLSLSLSLLPLDVLYISLVSGCVSPRVSLQTGQRPAQS